MRRGHEQVASAELVERWRTRGSPRRGVTSERFVADSRQKLVELPYDLARRFPESVKIRALDGTPCLHQLAAAQRAARYDDLYAHVEVKGQHRAVPLWNETRVWDRGD